MLNFTTLPPLSLYIHYPWCAQKCPYCDFNSHAVPVSADAEQRDKDYINALINDLEHELPAIWGRTVQTIFIGGGTPSLIQPEALQQLLSQIRARVKLSPMAEITMEANPGTVDQSKFTEFYDAGINRLSMGIQSFDDQLLKKIGRIHDSQQARLAIEQAKMSGFDNINLDLMYALPGQTLKSALDDVQQAIDFDTSHLSHYQLTLEPNTLFASQPPELPDDDLSYEMQRVCQQLLADTGFKHYEVSAYAKPGKQCRHNLNYWQFGDYLGIGAGAHGKISDAAQQTITRRWKEKHPQQYLETHAGLEKFPQNSTKVTNSFMIGGEQQLSRHDIGFEFMLNSSLLTDGFDSRLFFAQTGLPIIQIEKGLKKAVALGLIEWHQHHIRPTERGLQYLNELQELFL
ncbi:MAG: radical SAM family heme chaperone HemW [gamma proteobacterium symbiont of Bathyaustriella thionipta]|nr:radical SAM family heme chaperone HemW [gamma proteobacterium symbiont of Bathyaustriella thionipta]MCU7950120.1 radical SAM family heme chaperone HemW [gamma proteobacterium symbiont of Bathyaustriella thionipta]MCU7954560.1 radical SAM family heme chaperone HemW [gamma proteobacterium symbiont of Bathyaustriella thionipta]MCU7957192.1 radical SAM family heme chaperone HemW [gamma proteobacterium symbiont of Bathyaustriella thionipta]MCU7968452.1 radical SAM family heme chaperone HemW [gamm